MFDLEDKLVIFDISNTYFESRKSDSKLAKYGRSKEKRSDIPQKGGKAIDLKFKEKLTQINQNKGKCVYFIRTNYTNTNEKEL